MNKPEPVPSLVSASAMVGLAIVLQHIPREVTEDPPLLAMFPPLVAVVVVIDVIAVVVKVGTEGERVVNVISFP